MCCEVPENFSAGRLNRDKYECTDEAVFVCAAAPARFIFVLVQLCFLSQAICLALLTPPLEFLLLA